MTANVGTIDRIIRLVAGLALIAAALFSGAAVFAGTMMWVALAVGIVLVATSAMRFCPLYRILGMRTCKV